MSSHTRDHVAPINQPDFTIDTQASGSTLEQMEKSLHMSAECRIHGLVRKKFRFPFKLTRHKLLRLQAVVLLAILIPLAASAQNPQPPNLRDLQKLVTDSKLAAAKAQSDPLDYGYDLFFYANWPALLKGRGLPDPRKRFADTGTVLWETWKNSAETFRRCGLTPAGWEKPEPVPSEVQSRPQQPADSGKSWQYMTGNTQVDGFNLKDR